MNNLLLAAVMIAASHSPAQAEVSNAPMYLESNAVVFECINQEQHTDITCISIEGGHAFAIEENKIRFAGDVVRVRFIMKEFYSAEGDTYKIDGLEIIE